MSQLKRCSRCREAKDHAKFEKNRCNPDGRSFYCLECLAARRRERYPVRRLALLAQCKSYTQSAKGAATRKAYNKRYYAKNRQQELSRSKQWQQEHRPHCTKRERDWRSANKERAKEYKRNHEGRKRANGQGDITAGAWKLIRDTFRNRCVYCGESTMLERDHVVALSRGGEHLPHNLVPACRRCNAVKSDNPAPAFWWVKNA